MVVHPAPATPPKNNSFFFHRYREERLVAASDSTVYDIIAGLDNYRNWNPWIIDARGDTTPGSAVTVKALLYGRQATFRHRMIAAQRPTRFHWCDVGWFTVFVYGERVRTIERIDDHHCRYVCELRISGIGTPFARLFFGQFMGEGLKAEADALKQHAAQ